MKKIALAIALFLVICLAAGCVVVEHRGARGSGSNEVAASGQGEVRTYQTDAFDSVVIEGRMSNLHVYLAQGETDVRIDSDQAYLGEIDVDVRGNTLTVSTDFLLHRRVDLYITAPEYKSIDCRGAASFQCEDTITGDSLEVVIAGAASGALDIDYARFELRVAGACDMTLAGTAEDVLISCAGACEVDAEMLATKTCRLDLAGAGRLKVRCEEELDASVGGFATIDYWGNASVRRDSAGFSRITHRGD